jgi:hypothetical protein
MLGVFSFKAKGNTETDRKKIEALEYKANLYICLKNDYPTACHYNKLTIEDAKRTKEARANLNKARKNYYNLSRITPKLSRHPFDKKTNTRMYGKSAKKDSNCYGCISSITNRPKTIYVKGYYRRNGTYVHPHYKSRK